MSAAELGGDLEVLYVGQVHDADAAEQGGLRDKVMGEVGCERLGPVGSVRGFVRLTGLAIGLLTCPEDCVRGRLDRHHVGQAVKVFIIGKRELEDFQA